MSHCLSRTPPVCPPYTGVCLKEIWLTDKILSAKKWRKITISTIYIPHLWIRNKCHFTQHEKTLHNADEVWVIRAKYLYVCLFVCLFVCFFYFVCVWEFAMLGVSTDLDECNNPSANNCSSRADCANTRGSFECKCRSGYRSDGVNCEGKFSTSLKTFDRDQMYVKKSWENQFLLKLYVFTLPPGIEIRMLVT